MGGKTSRRKGHQWERDVAKRFREIFGDEVKRGLQSRSGTEVPDVDMPYFWVECKRGKQVNLRAALQQAITDIRPFDNRIPIAVCKDDRKEPVVVVLFDDFLALVSEWFALVGRSNPDPPPLCDAILRYCPGCKTKHDNLTIRAGHALRCHCGCYLECTIEDDDVVRYQWMPADKGYKERS